MNATPEQLAQADALQAKASDHIQAAQDSFDRCDTDGFLSQWAHGICAQRDDLQAQVLRNGGVWEFPALFDLEGNLVAAKLVHTRFGLTWGVLENDDPRSKIVNWIRAHPSRLSTMEKKGYREGTIRTKAQGVIRGRGRGLSGSAWACIVRLDGGFSRAVEIIDNGRRA